jgi:hypothetical protein
MKTFKKKKYQKPIFHMYIVEMDSALAAGSNVQSTWGSDQDGRPLLTDPNVETIENELFF